MGRANSKELEDSEADVVFFAEGPAGRVVVVIQAKQALRHPAKLKSRKPVFGAGRGTLTIVSEDDEHLKDFQEHQK